MKSKTFYYENYTDDFAVTKDLKSNIVGDDYKYETKNPFFWLFSFVVYFIIVKPLAWCILKLRFGYKTKNRKVLRKCRNKGYFIYGNHTNYLPDAFGPNIIRFRRNSIVVNSQTVSIKGIRTLVKALGAIPLGDTYQAKKKFFKCIKNRIRKKQSVMIFPEAHIWPYYNSVRPFDPINMKYQVILDVPAYTISYCYKKRKFFKIPKVIAYIDGPFYPDRNLEPKDRQEKLYNEVYNTIKDRTDNYSTYSVHTYLKKENELI